MRAPRGSTLAAVAVLAGSVVTVAAAAVWDLRVPAAHRAATQTDPVWQAAVAGLGLAVAGALLLRRAPRHPVAWLLCAAGVHWSLDGAASSWLAYATLRQPAPDSAAAAFWIYQRLGASLLIYLPLLLLLFPDGRLPTGRWRLGAYASIAASALLPAVLIMVPATVAQARSGDPLPAPFAGLNLDLTTVALPDRWWTVLLDVAFVAIPLSMAVPVAVVVRRYRRAAGVARTRMRWLLWAAVIDALVMLAALVLPGLASVTLGPAVGLTGAAIAVAVARPQLFDVDRLLGDTVRYGAMAATVLAVDGAVLAGTGAVLGRRLAERDAAVLALLVVTILYGPLRHRLWRLVRRRVLGRRDDPYRVVAGLAEQLERSDTPEDELLAVARAVAEAFRASYVAVEVDRVGGAGVVASYGTRPAEVRVLPITYRAQPVGRLVLPRHGARAALSPRDERLLGDVVRQAAFAARTAHLADELQRSRGRIVAAREEERRRLRRDLHDGLGPTLGGVALRIDAARNLATRRPHEADELLRQAREDATAAVADVRRLVHDLRPPALEDVGLLGAVRQQAQRLGGPGLAVTVDGDDAVDRLPAAVEVAAYRIVSEALANVARHAAARTCRVTMVVEQGALVVTVTDDGVGIPVGTPSGVGLVSLRERAAELGGECRIECPDGRGTQVRARLPLGLAEVT